MGDVRSMNNKHSLRALLHTVSFAGVLLLAHVGAINASEAAIPEGNPPKLPQVVWNAPDILIETYGTTDWSQVTSSLLSNPDNASNAKVFLIPLALGNAYLNRYGIWKDESDSEKALQYFESVTEGRQLWEKRLLTPMIAHVLIISVNRMHKICDDHWDLPAVQRKRASVLWENVKAIVKAEADYRLLGDPGDGSVGVNAWDAALFADATSFLPDDPQAAAWSEKARQLLYTSLNLPDPDTLFVPRQVTLPSRIGGGATVVTFRPVIDELSKEADSEVDDPAWNLPADHSDIVKETRIRKAFRGYSWKPIRPVPVMTTGNDLLEAVENSKSLLDYVLDNYLSHFPANSSCSEVRYTMPEDGEVQ
jgi:hypothetical protein